MAILLPKFSHPRYAHSRLARQTVVDVGPDYDLTKTQRIFEKSLASLPKPRSNTLASPLLNIWKLFTTTTDFEFKYL